MTPSPIVLPPNFSYIGVFLTFACQLRCSYCINHHGGDLVKARRMSKDDWIQAINRLQIRPDLPVTLQGGEPTVHKDFYEIVAGIDRKIPIDLITNLEIDIDKFSDRIPPGRMRREAPYASIRVSYHHGQSNFEELTRKVLTLQQKGYSIGIWEVEHPGYKAAVHARQETATKMGIFYGIKEFLGPWQGITYGTMRYANAVNSNELRHCECKTSELLIAPDGDIFRCHSDLYAKRTPIGHILDATPPRLGEWRSCAVFGRCNSCDIRAKTTNRFTESGYSGVQIKNIGEPYATNTPIIQVENTYGKK